MTVITPWYWTLPSTLVLFSGVVAGLLSLQYWADIRPRFGWCGATWGKDFDRADAFTTADEFFTMCVCGAVAGLGFWILLAMAALADGPSTTSQLPFLARAFQGLLTLSNFTILPIMVWLCLNYGLDLSDELGRSTGRIGCWRRGYSIRHLVPQLWLLSDHQDPDALVPGPLWQDDPEAAEARWDRAYSLHEVAKKRCANAARALRQVADDPRVAEAILAEAEARGRLVPEAVDVLDAARGSAASATLALAFEKFGRVEPSITIRWLAREGEPAARAVVARLPEFDEPARLVVGQAIRSGHHRDLLESLPESMRRAIEDAYLSKILAPAIRLVRDAEPPSSAYEGGIIRRESPDEERSRWKMREELAGLPDPVALEALLVCLRGRGRYDHGQSYRFYLGEIERRLEKIWGPRCMEALARALDCADGDSPFDAARAMWVAYRMAGRPLFPVTWHGPGRITLHRSGKDDVVHREDGMSTDWHVAWPDAVFMSNWLGKRREGHRLEGLVVHKVAGRWLDTPVELRAEELGVKPGEPFDVLAWYTGHEQWLARRCLGALSPAPAEDTAAVGGGDGDTDSAPAPDDGGRRTPAEPRKRRPDPRTLAKERLRRKMLRDDLDRS